MSFDICRRFSESATKIFAIEETTGLSLSYADFEVMAERAAGFLARNNIPESGRVALLCANSLDFSVLYFACLLGGRTAVPVNLLLPTHDIEFILGNAGLDAVIMDAAGEAKSAGLLPPSLKVFKLGEKSLYEELFFSGRGLRVKLSGERVFSICYTSGTTAKPKGVGHSVDSLFTSACAFNKASGIDEATRMLHVLPMAYMAGFLNTIICPFAAGASVVLRPAFNAMSPLNFWAGVFKHEINAFWLVPMMLSALLKIDRNPEAKAYCAKNACRVYTGTAALPLALKQDFENKYSMPVYESYGLSETLFVAANGPGIPYREGSVGLPLDGVSLELKPVDDEECSGEIRNELAVAVPWMMKGYFDGSGFSFPGLLSNSFPTGDLAMTGDDGLLSITGRRKDLIARGGIKISPRAIEEAFLSSGLVETVAVIGVTHQILGEEIVAALVPKSSSGSREALESFSKNRFTKGYGPDRLELFDTLPVGATGKILKAKLRSMLEGSL